MKFWKALAPAAPVVVAIVVVPLGKAVWPERFFRLEPAKGGLVRPPPDVSFVMSRLTWSIQQADNEIHESESDQVFVDIDLLICERVGFGVFARLDDHYECLHQDGRVLFKHAIGKEMFWWNMQDFGVPRVHVKSTKPRATTPPPPWVAYEP